MKKHILWLTFLTALMLTAGILTGLKTNLPSSSQKPAQTLMFLRTYENWAWGVSKRASVITSDGMVIPASEIIYGNDSQMLLKDDWGKALADMNLSGTPVIPQKDLEVMYAFVDEPAPAAPLGEYVNWACDYGQDSLYLLTPNPDGSYDRVQLCIHGDNAAVMQNERVRQFCNWMIQHGYFNAPGLYPANKTY